MIGVTFGEKHSIDDFDLILTEVSIGAPEIKTEMVSIPGRNGDLDLTDVLYSEPVFENRELSFTFKIKGTAELWPVLMADIGGFLHGQKLNVSIDSDPDYYYYGRCAVNQLASDRHIGTLVIYMNAEPYKYAVSETVCEVTGSQTVTLTNDRMPVIPTVTVTDETTITVDDSTVSLSEGTYEMTDFPLYEGDTTWEIETDGTVTITYRQGRL